MAKIGKLEKTFINGKEILQGVIQTLSLDLEIQLIPNQSRGSDNAPKYKIVVPKGRFTPEIGAAWEKVSRKGTTYLSLQMDDQSFPDKLYAYAFEVDENTWDIEWSRPVKATQPDAA